MAIKRFSTDHETHVHSPARSARLKRAKEKKIQKILTKYDPLGAYGAEFVDKVEGWVDDDFNDMEARRDEQKRFFESIEELTDIPIKSTGRVWRHAEERIGRIFGRIHKTNIQEGKDTILIFRDGDKSVYRVSFRKGETATLLHRLFKKGYVISTIDINYGDINKY